MKYVLMTMDKHPFAVRESFEDAAALLTKNIGEILECGGLPIEGAAFIVPVSDDGEKK